MVGIRVICDPCCCRKVSAVFYRWHPLLKGINTAPEPTPSPWLTSTQLYGSFIPPVLSMCGKGLNTDAYAQMVFSGTSKKPTKRENPVKMIAIASDSSLLGYGIPCWSWKFNHQDTTNCSNEAAKCCWVAVISTADNMIFSETYFPSFFNHNFNITQTLQGERWET